MHLHLIVKLSNMLANNDEDLLRMVKEIDPSYSLSEEVKRKLKDRLSEQNRGSMVVGKYNTRGTIKDQIQQRLLEKSDYEERLEKKFDLLENDFIELKKSSIASEGRIDMGAFFKWDFRLDASEYFF